VAGFKTNFLAGLLIGAALAFAAPLAGADLVALLSAPARAGAPVSSVQQVVNVQTVNRSAKSDRLHPLKATNDLRDSRQKPRKIPEGCDPAFSPLSKDAASNFSSRCMA
jgi:hypothetical protein